MGESERWATEQAPGSQSWSVGAREAQGIVQADYAKTPSSLAIQGKRAPSASLRQN
jgi:hypothetical protein